MDHDRSQDYTSCYHHDRPQVTLVIICCVANSRDGLCLAVCSVLGNPAYTQRLHVDSTKTMA
jgi:hypothetical protein